MEVEDVPGNNLAKAAVSILAVVGFIRWSSSWSWISGAGEVGSEVSTFFSFSGVQFCGYSR